MEMKTAIVTAMSTVVTVAVASYEHQVPVGRLFSPFFRRSMPFCDFSDLFAKMESIFDTLSFPQKYFEWRSFGIKAKRLRTGAIAESREDDEMGEIGEQAKATFIIHVQFRRNATWQGTIQWVEQNRTQVFRSTLEMIKLIDEAMEGRDMVPVVSWNSKIKE